VQMPTRDLKGPVVEGLRGNCAGASIRNKRQKDYGEQAVRKRGAGGKKITASMRGTLRAFYMYISRMAGEEQTNQRKESRQPRNTTGSI